MAATSWRKAPAEARVASGAVQRKRLRLIQAKNGSTVRFTTLRSVSVGLIRNARGGGTRKTISLRRTFTRTTTRLAVQSRTVRLSRTSGEELRLGNNQGRFALCFTRNPDLHALLLQLSHSTPRIGDARLELSPFDHALGMTVDGPADPVPRVATRRSASF